MKTIVLAVLFALTCGAGALAADARVEISADRNLGAWNRLYQDFAEGGEGDPLWQDNVLGPDRLGSVGIRLFRVDTVVGPLAKYAKGADGRVTADFSKVATFVRALRARGGEPLLCISGIPDHIQYPERDKKGDPRVVPTDPAEWQRIVRELVRYVNVEQKLKVRYWEVWNEPNDMPDYLVVYKLTAQAIREADPEAWVGGPAVSIYQFPWIKGVAEFCRKENLPLDFVSWHDYCRMPEHYARTSREARAYLDTIFPKAQIIIDEWNYHFALVPENDTHVGAARVSRILPALINSPVDYAPFFEAKDGWEMGKVFYGRWGVFTHNQRPKAVFYVFQSYARMLDSQVSAQVSDASMSVFATRDQDRVRFIVASEKHGDEMADMAVTGCPGASHVQISRYLVDAAHSNPIRATAEKLTLVERHMVPVAGGVVKFRALVPAFSSSLFEIDAGEGRPGLTLRTDVQVAASGAEIPFTLTLPPGRVFKSVTLEGDVSDQGQAEFSDSAQGPTARITARVSRGGEERHLFVTALAVDQDGNQYPASCRLRADRVLFAPPAEISLWPGVRKLEVPLVVENRSADDLEPELTWSRIPSFYAELPYALDMPDLPRVAVPARTARTFLVPITLPETVWGSMNLSAGLHLGDKDVDQARAQLHLVPAYNAIRRTIRPGKGLDAWNGIEMLPLVPKDGASPGVFGACWDDKNLYVLVRTRDEAHVQSKSGPQIWMHDSLQVAMDPRADARWQTENGLGPDDFEWAAGLDGRGRVIQHCWTAPAGVKPAAAARMKVRISRTGAGEEAETVYQAAFPWRSLGLKTCPERIGLSVLVNDADSPEKPRVFSLWGDGLAVSKNPWQYNRVFLKK